MPRSWRTKDDIQLLSLMHRRQAQIYRTYQKALLRRLTAERDNPEWVMSETHADELSKINTFLKTATQNVLDLESAREKLREAQDTDVLLAQLRHEFVTAAKTFTEDELKILARNLPEASWVVLAQSRTEVS